MTAPHRRQIRLYQEWLQASRGLSFDQLWRAVAMVGDGPRRFLAKPWDYFDLQSPTPYSALLAVNAFATSVHTHPSASAYKVMLPAVSYGR